MAELNWQGNSKELFEKMIKAALKKAPPGATEEMIRPMLTGMVEQAAAGGPVTEDVLKKMVEGMPEPQKSALKEVVAPQAKPAVPSGVSAPKLPVGEADIESILAKFAPGQENLIPALREIQKENGFVPSEAATLISEKLAVSLSYVYKSVTSYGAFSSTPKGRLTVKVCDGMTCHLKGSQDTLDEITGVAGNNPDITVEKSWCLGCCDVAPAVQVGGEVCDSETAKEKIETL